jgi:hypothetical protein
MCTRLTISRAEVRDSWNGNGRAGWRARVTNQALGSGLAFGRSTSDASQLQHEG